MADKGWRKVLSGMDALDSGRERMVVLPEPIPVHIVYWTAWVDDAGTLRFEIESLEAQRRIDVPKAHVDTTAGTGSIVAKMASRLSLHKLSDAAYLAAARLAWAGVKTLREGGYEHLILQEHLELFPIQVVGLEDFSSITLAGCRSRLREVSCADVPTVMRHYSGFFVEIRIEIPDAWDLYEGDREAIDVFVRDTARASFGGNFEIRSVNARRGSLLFGVDLVVIGTIAGIISCIVGIVNMVLNLVRHFGERRQRVGGKA